MRIKLKKSNSLTNRELAKSCWSFHFQNHNFDNCDSHGRANSDRPCILQEITFTHAWNVWNSAWKNKISHALDDVIAENVLLNWTILKRQIENLSRRQYLEIENSVRILNSSELSSESECIIWFPTLGD